jgi:hypothetical protein
LRSLISSPEQGIVYYPVGSDLYVLNTRTNEKEIVTTVQFTPRCLAVAKGWLCCGGDLGQFAVVNLKDVKTTPEFSLNLNLDADPDARLPLELDPIRRSITRDTASYLRRPRNNRYPLVADEKKIGTELVNCTTLWFPTEKTPQCTYKRPVAVVANNDCSVSILDLEDNSEILDKLTFPDFVNRSTMSPDGTILITICDDPFLYVHQRKQKPELLKGHVDPNQGYEWVQWGRIQLEGQRQADKSNMRGSFAASFSKSGKYLAIATQYGQISVFDTECLTEDGVEPLVIFTSSRPGRECGAIRAMEFSPEPFDLLAWTESSGRVSVADVRNHFLSRQHIMIDSQADDVERVLVSERPSEPVIDPRLRSFRTESPSSSNTPDYLGLDLDRRQLGHLSRLMLDRHQTPLTPEELEVVSVSTLARRQRDEASGTFTWGSIVRGQRPAATAGASTNGEGSSSNDRRISTAGYPAALREFINPERTAAASFRSFINERNQERDRRLQQQEPRRRGSVTLANAEQSIERETLGTSAPRTNREISLERLTLTPPRLLDSPRNPWVDLDPPYRSRFPTSPPLDRSARLRVELEDDDRREFAHRLRQPWGPIDGGGGYESTLVRGMVRSGPLETMGCCWSPDGKIL